MSAVTVLLLLAIGQASQTPTAPDPALIRIHVHTDEKGVDQELAARRTSQKDLAAALASKKKLIALVDNDELADVSIEITGRSITVPRVVIGLAGRPGEPPSPGLVRRGTLSVTLESGPSTLRLTNRNTTSDNPGGWKSAAENIGDQVEKWVREQREAILKRRRPPTPALHGPREVHSRSRR